MSFAFVMVTLCFGTSLAPRLAGFTVPARSTRDKSHGRPFIICGCGQVFLVSLGRRIVGGACRSYLPQVVACRWDRRSPSPSGSGCLGTGVLALDHETVGFVSLGPVALVLFAPCLLCEELAVILVFGGGCGACAHPCEATASGLWSLGSSLPYTGSVGLCWSGVARSCSPGQITASVLVPGSWTWLPRLLPAVRLPPMGWLGWWVCVCLHFLKWCLYYLMEI